MPVSTPLLKTKLYIPPPRSSLVPRPHLIERMNMGLNHELTLISAPAGFGKTTLLSGWASGRVSESGNERAVAWLSLDEGDNDPARFWTYFIAALQTIHKGIGEAALAVLQSPQPSPIEALLTGLINEIAQVPGVFALVLDDFHVITDQSVNNAVTFFLDNMPPQMHLILSSRADPPWPLARLRASRQITEFRANDLRFTSQEAATFLKEIMRLDLSPEQVATLEERTEGWIVGLQMAALSMQGREDVSGFITALTGTHRFILDYLVEEVLDQQSPSIQEFLLKTSILERMTPPLCNTVTAREDSQGILTQLEQANLFLIPLDDERRWYRYHHLFADLLCSRLQQTQPEQVLALHRQASKWYEQNDLVAAAVSHALAAKDVSRAARLIAENAIAMICHGELTTVMGWLKALPENMVRSRPWLCITYAWARVYAGQLDAVDRLLQNAESALNGLEEPDDVQYIAGHVAAIRAYVAGFRGESSRAVELARTALEGLPEEDLTMRGFALSLLGTALRDDGDLAGAAQASAEAVAISRASGDVRVGVTALCELAVVQICQGQLYKAAATCHDALHLASELTGWGDRQLPITGLVYARLSSVLREQNDLQAAVRYARQAVELSERWEQADVSSISYSCLARALQVISDAEGALNAIQKARQMADNLSPWYGSVLAAWEARLRLVQGDVVAAVRWAEASGLSADDEFTLDSGGKYRTLARVFIAQGRLDEALRLLARLLRTAEAAEAMYQAIETLVLQAQALQAQARNAQSLDALERALALAEPEAWVRVFVNEGAPMERLLRQAAARGIKWDYVSTLLAALEREAKAKAIHPSLVESLSERELEVLRLLATGLSNKDIAQTLFVAVGTVKQHLKSIYGKLQVHNRTEAASRARDLSLL